jgi:hypothetical protein
LTSQAGGRDGADAFLDGVEQTLRAVMVIVGAKNLAALRTAPRLVTGELARWLAPRASRSSHPQRAICSGSGRHRRA